MSTIAIVVKAALALEQTVQGLVSECAHYIATRHFDEAVKVEAQALTTAEDAALKLERARAKRAADLIEAHKKAMIRLHEGIDNELDLVDGRKAQELARAAQHRNSASVWQGTRISADVAAENARKAVEQLS